ncbi:MAG: SDR family oxidoreductase [Thermoplasmata archaeon]|nr:SDR family oxidoreductase [Thermoplasmata archaeon]
MATEIPISTLFDLKGHVALVTGGGRGIGEAICLRLAQAGAAVAVVDMDETTAQRTAGRIADLGGKAIALQCNVAEPAADRKAVATVVGRLGGLDILVNNAGIFPFSPVTDTAPELWDRVLSVNLGGSFFLAQEAAKAMMNSGKGGSIINIASVDAFRPTGNLAHYDASKGGLVMLTRSLALELGPKKIRVNAIAPGSIDTPGAQAAMGAGASSGAKLEELLKGFLARIPLGRMGTPDDIACAALFLASPAAAYVTGTTLVVDGGYLVG